MRGLHRAVAAPQPAGGRRTSILLGYAAPAASSAFPVSQSARKGSRSPEPPKKSEEMHKC
jgi:hypothetical protein